jgi:MFS family permease
LLIAAVPSPQISFTFILPLFPQLVNFYRQLETTQSSSTTVLARILTGLNAYKQSFARPITDRYDIVLLGGALGSLFSLCQAIASPVIGALSDRYGRRTALLWSMVGNIASVALWCAAVDFRTFLASRIVGGLSEGNVQLAMAIATDISSDADRGKTMALVGACFSVAFTFGPALGAALSNVNLVAANPFATAAGVSLVLIVVETLYLWYALPETNILHSAAATATSGEAANGSAHEKVNGSAAAHASEKATAEQPATLGRTNSHITLNLTHFFFILFFSGMEFSLTFMTYDLFSYNARQSGQLLGYIGLIASLLQGSVTRRMKPLFLVRMGVASAAAAFLLLARLQTTTTLYAAATLLAVTSSSVVTGLNSLSSFEAARTHRGAVLGNHRSWGQVGRAAGPLIFCSLYWWAGRQAAYETGAVGMAAVLVVVAAALRNPPVGVKEAAKIAEKKEL